MTQRLNLTPSHQKILLVAVFNDFDDDLEDEDTIEGMYFRINFASRVEHFFREKFFLFLIKKSDDCLGDPMLILKTVNKHLVMLKSGFSSTKEKMKN